MSPDRLIPFLRKRFRGRTGFTLIELIVAMVVLALMLGMMLTLTDSTGRIWRQSANKIGAFQEARAAFEAVTRTLGQATLGTYWDYDDRDRPTQYLRSSHLHFIAAPATELVGSGTVGQSVFFQAPLGQVDDGANFGGLETLLNVCGFYVEFGSDSGMIPSFVGSGRARDRHRLIQVRQPAEELDVYVSTAGDPGTWDVDWVRKIDLATFGSTKFVLAENIIAFVLLPRVAPDEEELLDGTGNGDYLSPNYRYDSRAWESGAASPPAVGLRALSRNQLPPLIEVVMVVIDEATAIRLDQEGRLTADAFGQSSLFQDARDLDDDLETLRATLVSDAVRADYRIFRSTVSIKGAKWSFE